jgi:hypothetical protein
MKKTIRKQTHDHDECVTLDPAAQIEGWVNKWKCAVDIAARAQLESEFWKSRSINFEATLRTIRHLAVDSDIRQLASEAIDKSHEQ